MSEDGYRNAELGVLMQQFTQFMADRGKESGGRDAEHAQAFVLAKLGELFGRVKALEEQAEQDRAYRLERRERE